METRHRGNAEARRSPRFVRALVAVAGALVASLVIGLVLHDLGTDRTDRAGETPRITSRTAPIATTNDAPAADSVAGETVAAEPVREEEPIGPVTFGEAETVFASGDCARAAALFTRYAEANPRNVWGHYLLGLSQWKAGQADRAEDAFLDALAIRPDHVKSRIGLGRLFLEGDRAGEAVSVLTQVVADAPDCGAAHRVLGRAYHTLGRGDEALAAYRQALTLDENDAWSLNNYGLLLIEAEEFAEALAPLAKACEVAPDEAIFRNNLGIALERTENYRAAREAYAHTLELDEHYDKARVSLARIDGRPDLPATAEMSVAELAARFLPDPLPAPEVEIAGLAEPVAIVPDGAAADGPLPEEAPAE